MQTSRKRCEDLGIKVSQRQSSTCVDLTFGNNAAVRNQGDPKENVIKSASSEQIHQRWWLFLNVLFLPLFDRGLRSFLLRSSQTMAGCFSIAVMDGNSLCDNDERSFSQYVER